MSQLDEINESEPRISLAVKIQREGGDTTGALNALRDVVNAAIGIYTKENSFESYRRAVIIQTSFDKARLVYQRARQPAQAVAAGIVAYFIGIKRTAAIADWKAATAAELRSPQYIKKHELESDVSENSAQQWETEAKENLAEAYAALTDAFILAEAERLLKKMKLDVALAKNILAAVSPPPHNPWELFNVVMAALGHRKPSFRSSFL